MAPDESTLSVARQEGQNGHGMLAFLLCYDSRLLLLIVAAQRNFLLFFSVLVYCIVCLKTDVLLRRFDFDCVSMWRGENQNLPNTPSSCVIHTL